MNCLKTIINDYSYKNIIIINTRHDHHSYFIEYVHELIGVAQKQFNNIRMTHSYGLSSTLFSLVIQFVISPPQEESIDILSKIATSSS